MDNDLGRALERIFRDLEVTGAPVPRAEASDWQDGPTAASAMLRSSLGWGMGVWIDTAQDEEARVAALAEQVQEFVVEDLPARHLPSNWPRCPDHPDNHPMAAAVRDGVAVWTCPATGRRVEEIGGLTA